MPVVYLDMVKDERFEQVRMMINKDILKTFRAIFLHLPVGAVAQELNVSEDKLIAIIEAPQKYPFVIYFRIGEILNVTEWKMLQLIYTQAMEEQKAELDKYFTDLLRRRARRLKKMHIKAARKKGRS